MRIVFNRKIIWGYTLMFVFILIWSNLAYAGGVIPPRQDPNDIEWVPGEVLVKFKDDVDIKPVVKRGKVRTDVTSINNLNTQYQVIEMEKVFKTAEKRTEPKFIKTYTGEIREVPQLFNIYKLKVPEDSDIQEIIDAYKSDPNVEYAEPNYIARITAIPNDPDFYNQWGFHNTGQYHLEDADIDAPEAWDIETGDSTIIIGIIDTGVDWGHPDLVDKMVSTGYDFVNDDNDAMDDNGHGSHVAGIAAAATNNAIGIAGIAWNCKILPVKVLQSNGYGTYSDVAAGVVWAADSGAKVINMSLGGYAESYILRDALENAYTTAVIIAAAGNDGKSIPFYPAAWSFVIGIGASDVLYDQQTDTWYEGVAVFSNGGLNADLYAPGVNIYSTIPLFHPHTYSYASWNGTSMAAPFVTGTVALICSYSPDWSNELIHGQLINTTDAIVGGIRLNAHRALIEVAEPQLSLYSHTIIDTLPGDDQDGIADAGETVEMVFDIQNTWGQAYNVQAILRYHSYEDTSFINIIDSIATFGGGVSPYAQVNNETNPFKFFVKSSTPNNTDIYFDYEITSDGGYTFSGTFYITAQRGIEISGIIGSDTTLTNDYLYIVTGNVLVDQGVTLTIEPGTRIQFNSDKYVRIDGTLLAIGTEDSMIVFTSNAQNPAAGDWSGIRFTDSSVDAEFDVDGNYLYGSIIKYTEIEFSGESGLVVNHSSPYIAHNHIHDNIGWIPSRWVGKGGGIYLYNSSSRIEHNLIQSNSAGYGAGIYTKGSTPYIAYNVIEDNFCRGYTSGFGGYWGAGGGIYVSGSATVTYNVIQFNRSGQYIMGVFDGGGVCVDGGEPVITNNNIFGNSNVDGYGYTTEGRGGGVALWSGGLFQNNNVMNNYGGISLTKSVVSAISFNLNNILDNRQYHNEYNVWMEISYNVNGQDNFWGTTISDSIDDYIWDFLDDFDLGLVTYEPFETTPVVDAPGFLYLAELDPPSPIGVETVAFTLTFSKSMYISIQPNVKFGVIDPYTQHVIEGDWVDSTHWQGTYAFSITTGDGINRLRVTQAKDNEGMEIPKDTRFAFVVDATGASSEGFVAQAGIGKVDLSWRNIEMVDLMGYNMYRYHQINDSTFSDTTLINTSMITDTTYADMTVEPNITYFFMYTAISTDFIESDQSDPASATPFDASPGDANGDMNVDVLDIISIVSYMLMDNPEPFLFDAADINDDGSINVLDIIGVVNIILGQPKLLTGINAEEAVFSLMGDQLMVSSDGLIGGYQFKIHGQVNDLEVSSLYPMEVATKQISSDTLLVLVYSTSRNFIPDGNNPVLSFSISENITLSDLVVADPYGNQVQARLGTSGELLVPDEFSLSQNYPNPFNSATTIAYSIPRLSDVTITVYNILGQVVHIHKMTDVRPGYYTYPWSGRNQIGNVVSSGVYFYQLEVEGFIDTKKMLLMK